MTKENSSLNMQAKDSEDILMVFCCFNHSVSLVIFLLTPLGLAKSHALHIRNSQNIPTYYYLYVNHPKV